MKIFLGAAIIDQVLEAKGWVEDNTLGPFLTSLERWAAEREARSGWGECYVFIEVTCPTYDLPSGSHSQIDLLICFSNRIALCELKRHADAARLNLERVYKQIQGQIRWLEGLCRNTVVAPGYLSPFLVLPNLSAEELASVRTAWIDHFNGHHISTVGVHQILKGKHDLERRPYHVMEALSDRLTTSRSATLPKRPSLQKFIRERLREAGTELREFNSFSAVFSYLRHSIDEKLFATILTPPPVHYVPGIRTDLLANALNLFAAERVLEIVGPPESGKTVFAKELIQRSTGVALEVELKECNSPAELCAKINSELRGTVAEGLGYERFLHLLMEEPNIYWIRKYDIVSSKSLEELLRFFHSVKASPQARARWVIESVELLRGLGSCRCELPALDNLSISQILQQVDGGGAFSDREEVVRLARGNPGRAIRYWQSASRSDIEVAGEFQWFLRQLTSEERLVLKVLCVAVSKAPLGLTQKLVVDLTTRIYEDRPLSVIRNSVQSLLSKLAVRRLATVSRLEPDWLPQSAELLSVTLVSNVAFDLTAGVVSSVSETEINRWHEKLNEALWDTAELNTLAHVTVELNIGDLEPFLRSSFRHTHLSRVHAWVEHTQWQPENARQIYLLKALRCLLLLGKGQDVNVSEDLGEPERGDKAQTFAYNLVTIGALTRQRVKSINVRTWLLAAEKIGDPELLAETCVSMARALPVSDRAERASEAWKVLSQRWERFTCNSTARIIVMHEALAFLNRSKLWRGVVEKETAFAMTQQLAGELLTEGVRLENLQLMCDALFYRFRAEELGHGRNHSVEVLNYLPVLKFIEEAQGKTVRTIQVLLTQGSVYRHLCSRQDITWPEFRAHFTKGFECYSRALSSALARQHPLHILNATSYMMTLCCKALRFPAEEAARQLTLEKSEMATAQAERVLRLFAEGAEGERRVILTSIQLAYPILTYINTVTKPPEIITQQRDKIGDSFRALVETLLTFATGDDKYFTTEQEMKYLNESFTNLTRALTFGRRYDNNNLMILKEIGPELLRLIASTRNIKKDGKPISGKLSRVLSEYTFK